MKKHGSKSIVLLLNHIEPLLPNLRGTLGARNLTFATSNHYLSLVLASSNAVVLLRTCLVVSRIHGTFQSQISLDVPKRMIKCLWLSTTLMLTFSKKTNVCFPLNEQSEYFKLHKFYVRSRHIYFEGTKGTTVFCLWNKMIQEDQTYYYNGLYTGTVGPVLRITVYALKGGFASVSPIRNSANWVSYTWNPYIYSLLLNSMPHHHC